MAGTNFLAENQEFRIFSANESGCCTRFYESIGRFFNWLIPLGSDIEYIQARYDHIVSGFFIFFRFLVAYNIATALVFTFLLIYHLVTYDGSFSARDDHIYPIFILFSSFNSEFKVKYAGTLQLFIFVTMVCTVTRWVRFFEQKTKHNLYNKKDMNFTKLMFRGWDWTITEDVPASNFNEVNHKELKLMLHEEEIRSAIDKRTFAESACLFALRAVLLLANLAFVVAGWAGIILIYFYEKNWVDKLNDIFIVKYFVFLCAKSVGWIYTKYRNLYHQLYSANDKSLYYGLREVGLRFHAHQERDLEAVPDHHAQPDHRLHHLRRILI